MMESVAKLPPSSAEPAASEAQPIAAFQLKRGAAKVFARAADISEDIWRRAFGDSWKDVNYYRLLELTMAVGFVYQYLVLYDQDGDVDGLQPLILVTQDVAASMNGLLARAVQAIRTRFRGFLQARMLMAGCLVGDTQLGLVGGGSADTMGPRLAEALLTYSSRQRVGLVTMKDFPVEKRAELRGVSDSGYTRLSSYPSLQLDLTFASFEEYMQQRLSKATRKTLRRKFRKAAQAHAPLTLEVLTDCSEVIDEVHPLYLAVAERSSVTFETFTRDYFLQASRQMPDRFRYFIWRQAGKAVAFSFCTVWGDTIYDNDLGLDYRVALELSLYYITFRDIIEWALQQRLRRYVSAPFGYETKRHLRLEFVPHDLYVRHTSGWMNPLLRQFAPMFGPTRSDPTLRRHFEDSAG